MYSASIPQRLQIRRNASFRALARIHGSGFHKNELTPVAAAMQLGGFRAREACPTNAAHHVKIFAGGA
jgi:hypothetical protein